VDRALHYGDSRLPDRYWAKVIPEPNSGCWLWLGFQTPRGYGMLGFKRLGVRSNQYGHRMMFRAATGQSPGDLEVCHHCDQPSCVNPEHLFLGNRFDNMRDAAAKGRTASGVRNGSSKLAPAQVIEIRQRHQQGESMRRLARAYGVSDGAIAKVIRRQTWARV
jgi:hypothetical protein